MSKPVIGFAGLTHLGLCSLAAAASKGFETVGWHDDPALILALRGGRLPVREPDLDRLMTENAERIELSADPGALGRAAIVHLAIDVPTDDSGQSDLAPIEAAVDRILPHLGETAILVVLCQVPPGFTRGRVLSADRLYYQVETLIFGRGGERATQPERFIVGCADPTQPLPPAYAEYLAAYGCPVLPMRYESAELAKIAINCFLVASVSVTNTLAELCEKIGADWGEIAPSLRLDARIGPKAYLDPGLGIGGGNLERDLATVCRLIDREGGEEGVIASCIGNSRHMKEWSLRTFRKAVPARDARIGVLGLAYKQDTHSTKNSPSLDFLSQVGGHAAKVHDPVVPAAAAPGTTGVTAPEEVGEGAAAVLILTPWPQYRDLDLDRLAQRMAGRVLIDPYGMMSADAVAAAGLDHYVIGRPPRFAA